MENEIWIKIPDFPDYEISSHGRIKSFKRGEEKIIKQHVGDTGYYRCGLFKDGKAKQIKVHQIMAVSFLGHTLCGMKSVVDHIDSDKLNNNLSNLRIVTSRQNNINYRIYNSDKYTSKYVGVFIEKRHGKNNEQRIRIRACIGIKGKKVKLGTFKTEEDAHLAYVKKLNEILCSENLP